MRTGIFSLSLVALVACSPPTESDRLSPDLLEELDSAGAGDVMRVLLVGESDEYKPRQAMERLGLAPAQEFAHMPVAVFEGSPDDVRALAQTGFYLTPDRPMFAAGNDCGNGHFGVELTTDKDLVVRATGAQKANKDGYTGEDVVIALVDSGVRRNQKDFPKDALVDWADFVDGHDEDARKDPYGHGTMVAGVLVGDRKGIRGVSPDVSLVSARVLDDEGNGRISSAIEALDWIVENADQSGVRVVNMSIGASPHESFTRDPLALAAERAVREGLIVVAAAGNYGESDGMPAYGGIVSPANHPAVITVGALDTYGTAIRSDDRVATFSSRGPTLFDGLGKPDLVAPGTTLPLYSDPSAALWAEQPGARLVDYGNVDLSGGKVLVASGTSFAAPAVAGTIALLLEANPSLSAMDAKAILELTATPVGDPTWLASGAGSLNSAGAVRLSKALRNSKSIRPSERSDLIEGQNNPWGLTLLWDGYDSSDLDLSSWNANGVLAVGDVEGTGILWGGELGIRYIGVRVSGASLLDSTQPLWSTDGLWGTGILWGGELGFSSGRVWTSSSTWKNTLVWPDNLSSTGVASPLFGEPEFSGLTTPVPGAADPTPQMPMFGAQ